jgi:hypothetical protein
MQKMEEKGMFMTYSKGRFDGGCSIWTSGTVDVLCFRKEEGFVDKAFKVECLTDERALLVVRLSDRSWDHRFGLFRSTEFCCKWSAWLFGEKTRQDVTSSKMSSESVSLLFRLTGIDRYRAEFLEIDLKSLSDWSSFPSRTVVRDKPLSTRECSLVYFIKKEVNHAKAWKLEEGVWLSRLSEEDSTIWYPHAGQTIHCVGPIRSISRQYSGGRWQTFV